MVVLSNIRMINNIIGKSSARCSSIIPELSANVFVLQLTGRIGAKAAEAYTVAFAENFFSRDIFTPSTHF